MKVHVKGGGWVSAKGYGRLGDGSAPVLAWGDPILPAGAEVFKKPVPRYGRFDAFTKMGCAAVGLALSKAPAPSVNLPVDQAVGMIVSSRFDTLRTDTDYYQTTLEQGGLLASPNLFSYTLPVIVLGECATLFGLTGPTFCVGENHGRGLNALSVATGLLEAGKASRMLAGWIDSPPDGAVLADPQALPGAAFVLLEAVGEGREISLQGDALQDAQGKPLNSIFDLFA